MDKQQTPSGDRESLGHDPYASHPVLSAVPREVRQRIVDQLEHDSLIGAIKTLRDAVDGDISLKEAKDVIDGLRQPGKQTWSVKLASGKIDKGTTLTFYRDGTFIVARTFATSEPDRLVGFSFDIDSMRRKSCGGESGADLTQEHPLPARCMAADQKGADGW